MGGVLGIDPDSTHTGWAIADSRRIHAVGVWKTTRALAGITIRHLMPAIGVCVEKFKPAHAIVEGQSLNGRVTPSDDIIKLAHLSAGMVGILVCHAVDAGLISPEAWKGQVPKPIHQARTFAHYGIACDRSDDYAWPVDPKAIEAIQGGVGILRGQWKHVADAVGLALWLSKRLDTHHAGATPA